MATLIVENIPAEVYERLQQRAASQRTTPPEEMLHLLQRALREDDLPATRLPEFIPGEEVSAPIDLPRTSEPVPVIARSGQARLPDTLRDEEPGT